MKYNKIFSALVGLSLIGAASCTDEFNDHYASVNNGGVGGSNLWETITLNPEYSNFAKVLQATEYDRDLAGSQVFTVFAPSNDVLTDEQTALLIDSFKTELAKDYQNNTLKRAKTATVREFVQSHIALYNYSVANSTDTIIRMMNGKWLKLNNESFDGNAFNITNNIAGNGVFFGVNGMAEYLPSAFEAIKIKKDIDSLRNFVYMEKPYALHNELLDEKKSVPGDIVAGKQTFLDSVTIISNKLLTELKAKLDNEDSTYYCVFPTNKVWKEQLERNKQLFNFVKDEPSRDSLMYVLPRLAIIKGTQFSKAVNPKLGETENIDSVKSTYCVKYEERNKVGEKTEMKYEYRKPYEKGGVFYGTTPVKISNGLVYMADEWNFKRTDGFLFSSVMEGENRAGIYAEENTQSDSEYYNSCRYQIYDVASYNTAFYSKVSDHRVACVSPESNSGGKMLLQFENVFSNVDYDMYVYTVPAAAVDTAFASSPKKSHFRCKVIYDDENYDDAKKDHKVIDVVNNVPKAGTVYVKAGDLEEYLDMNGNPQGMTFQTSEKELKKIKIGTFNFPTCTYNSAKHRVKLEIESCPARRDAANNIVNKDIYIDKIVLVPSKE